MKTPNAPAGSIYTAVLVVGHGCHGSETTAISVQIPAGFDSVLPSPKAGWTLDVQPRRFVRPDGSQGSQAAGDIAMVSWTLATRGAAHTGEGSHEFELRGKLPEQPGPLWFKVLQTCATGQSDWSEIPASGVSTQGLAQPAVLLQVGPAAARTVP